VTGPRRWQPALLALLSTLLVAGCTTIPTSSSPQVVRTLPRDSARATARPDLTPHPGAGPYEILQQFVSAGVDADAGHSIARQFLTKAAAGKWQDDPTVILDETAISEPTFAGDGSAAVTVSGRRVGMIDATGVFTPVLKGMGTGDLEKFTFVLTRASGQWRINQLQPGVVISQSGFASMYRARSIYFFNAAQSILVPDLRYTALSGQALATWLLQRLVGGPRPELAQSVINEVPDQSNKATVQIGDPITVEMPGSSQLQANDQNNLAAQIAFTLGQVEFAGAGVRLTDGGRPVRVPAASGNEFSTVDFTGASPNAVAPGAKSYFLRDGAVYSAETGQALPGFLGQPARNLVSVAFRRSAKNLQVAGVTADGNLEIGDDTQLAAVRIPAAVVSRPEWSPQDDDVWFGAGARDGIYRVSAGSAVRPVSASSAVGSLPPGRVSTIRFSPDGVRVALVIRTAAGTGTVWLGSVVNSGADVRIDSLEPITPSAMSVTDLAWADPTRLLLIAAAPGAQPQVSEMLCDGSDLTPQTAAGLPGVPTSIAAAPQQDPLVSANGQILALNGSTWTPVGAGSSAVVGTNPAYAP